MITEIKIENFKSIGEALHISLKPLTIFVGANGSGKSTILEAITLMSQSENKELTVNGPLVQYPRFKAIFHKMNTKIPLTLGLTISLTNSEVESLNKKFAEAELEYSTKSLSYEFSFSTTEKEEILFIQHIIKTKENELLKFWYKRDEMGIEETAGIIDSNEHRVRPDVNLNHFLTRDVFQSDVRKYNNLFSAIALLFVKRLHNKVFLIQSTRGKINYSSSSGEDSDWIGPNGEYLIQILSKIFSKTEYLEIRNKIIKWIEKFGIANLSSGWMGPNALESSFRDPILKSDLNLALAGFGSKQALAVITQLFWSSEGDVLLIEEPEISLHPAAQIYLPELFAESIKEKKSIIVTTHSEFLILALSRPIRSKLINTSDIAIYNVEKTPEGTKIKELSIGENGYIKDWIPSFTQVESTLMKEFLESVPKE